MWTEPIITKNVAVIATKPRNNWSVSVLSAFWLVVTGVPSSFLEGVIACQDEDALAAFGQKSHQDGCKKLLENVSDTSCTQPLSVLAESEAPLHGSSRSPRSIPPHNVDSGESYN